MTSQEAFESVLLAARAGAEWAWRDLYNEVSSPVLSYVRARGAPDPEDVLGDVFLQVVRKLGSFEGDRRQFRAWTLTIAHHRLVDNYRGRVRRPEVLSPVQELVMAAPQGDAEAAALEGLQLEEALSLIRKLPQVQQDVLLLRLVAGLSCEEVAAVIGRRSSAVRVVQHRAIKALRKEFSRLGVTL